MLIIESITCIYIIHTLFFKKNHSFKWQRQAVDFPQFKFNAIRYHLISMSEWIRLILSHKKNTRGTEVITKWDIQAAGKIHLVVLSSLSGTWACRELHFLPMSGADFYWRIHLWNSIAQVSQDKLRKFINILSRRGRSSWASIFSFLCEYRLRDLLFEG